MSGIAGIHYFDGRTVDPSDIERMIGSLAHRGPDGGGTWYKGSAGLGNALLRTTPESNCEVLPLVHGPGQLVLAADARIDNRADLFSALDLDGRPQREVADSELIMAAYLTWGEYCPEKLVGDYAFAIWDDRKQVLFCARDIIGARPFYYCHSGRYFAFASEIKALLALKDMPRELNYPRVAEHLTWTFQDRTSTFYRHIYRLPAAHVMTVSRAGKRLSSYWSLDPVRELHLASDGEYADAFREIFSEAVNCRLRSTTAVGCTLSGGLDSSSIACTARLLTQKLNGSAVHTFSAIFPGLPEKDLKRIDERNYVDAVLSLGSFRSHFVRADRLSPLCDINQVLWHMDEAFLAPNLYMHWSIFQEAHKEGIRVLLDGTDGDTTVSHGLHLLAELARSWRLMRLLREAGALSRRYGSANTPLKLVWEYGFKPLVPDGVLRLFNISNGSEQSAGLNDAIVNPTLAKQVGLQDHLRALRKHRPAPRAGKNGAHWRGLTAPLIPYVLEIADKSAAAFSLEVRYPFFDRRLMEFCLSLPPDQKLHNGWTRMVMRRAMEGILPRQVQWRADKANLSPSFTRNLLERERTTLNHHLIEDTEVIKNLVDTDVLRQLYCLCIGSVTPKSSSLLTIYGVLVLALWLKSKPATFWDR